MNGGIIVIGTILLILTICAIGILAYETGLARGWESGVKDVLEELPEEFIKDLAKELDEEEQ